MPVQKWNSILKADWWDNLFGGVWWKKLGFMLLCSNLGLLFLPCMIPCFIRLIHSVIQGMQITTMPLDAESAEKGKPRSIMVLTAKSTHVKEQGPREMEIAQEMLTKFEKECEKLEAVREMLEKFEAEMRQRENQNSEEYKG